MRIDHFIVGLRCSEPMEIQFLVFVCGFERGARLRGVVGRVVEARAVLAPAAAAGLRPLERIRQILPCGHIPHMPNLPVGPSFRQRIGEQSAVGADGGFAQRQRAVIGQGIRIEEQPPGRPRVGRAPGTRRPLVGVPVSHDEHHGLVLQSIVVRVKPVLPVTYRGRPPLEVPHGSQPSRHRLAFRAARSDRSSARSPRPRRPPQVTRARTSRHRSLPRRQG